MKSGFGYNIMLSFRLIRDPEKYRNELGAQVAHQKTKLYQGFILPLVLVSSIMVAVSFTRIDGPKIGALVFGVTLLSYVMIGGLLGFGARLMLQWYKAYSAKFIYALAFVLFWIYLGSLVQSILILTLGIYGRTFGNWPVKLASVWLASYALKEILFALVPVEAEKLKNLANAMTVLLVVIGLGVPYLSELVIDVIVRNIL